MLVGRNGSGKSTLLRLIAAAAGVGGEGKAGGGAGVGTGDVEADAEGFVPTQGSIVRNYNARVGLFTQVGFFVCLFVCGWCKAEHYKPSSHKLNEGYT